MKLRLACPNGSWSAEAEVLSKAGTDLPEPPGPTEKDGDWLALDPLRRPRMTADVASARVVPRTWLALVRLTRLAQELPAPPGKRLTLEMDLEAAPPVPCVLDTPVAPPAELKDYVLDATATSIALEVVLGDGGRPPVWIKSVRLRRAAGEALPATLSAILGEILGAGEPAPEDRLVFDADGLAFTGTRTVPWWDPAGARRGRFRLAIERAEAGATYRLVLERSPEWLASLRRFQAAAVAASARPPERDGLPAAGTSSVGLAAAPPPREIAWRWRDGAWALDLGSSLFEVELRGVADGVARWRPAVIAIDLGPAGTAVRCSAGDAVSEGSAALRYGFESDGTSVLEDRWRAELQLAPIAESLAAALDLAGAPAAGAARRVWILTETGPLAVPFDAPPPGPAPAAEAAVPGSVLSGVLSLCEVPWIVIDEHDSQAPLAPDLSGVRSGRVFVLGARAASATFRFASPLVLRRVELALDGVHARAEECLPLYVPPAGAPRVGPPPLPRPEEATAERFFDLPLEQREGRARDGATRVGLRLELRPGRSAENARREGAWIDRALRLSFPATAARALCWFRPAGLRWIPSLPWFADPRERQEERIAAERTYLPLEPRTGEEPLVLGAGRSWFVPRLESGRFEVPRIADPGGGPSRSFAWVTPDLPGMAFGLVPGERITIRHGRPAGGKVEWTLRAGLPLLDELHALRVLEARSPAAGGAPESEEEWWRRLVELAALGQGRRDVLFRAQVELREGVVLRETDLRVELRNLYAAQSFPGRASIDALAPGASVGFANPEGPAAHPIAAIAAGSLLEGPSCRFEVAAIPAGGSPVLVPSAATEAAAAPVEIRAGCLVPHPLGDGRTVFDQSGRISGPLGNGRPVAIPPGEPAASAAAPAGVLEPYFQWTREIVDLGSAAVELKLHFVALPVGRGDGRWAFARDSRGDVDEVLRDHRWATIGPARLFGLTFQLLRLERLAFPAADAEPVDPDEIVVSGVLHAQGERIRLADEETQVVRAHFTRDAAGWRLDRVEGQILWPLYAATPDGADATAADVGDPLPWVEAPVELERSDGQMRLRIGTAARPARLVFRFLDRTWELPVDLEGTAGGGALRWRVRPSVLAAAAGLRATGGTVGLQEPGEIDFEVIVAAGAGLTLVDVDLAVGITAQDTAPRLRRARFLATGESGELAGVEEAEIAAGRKEVELRLAAGRLTLAANVPPGFRTAADFDLLPGWSVDGSAPLHAYADLVFAPPAASGRSSSVPVSEAQLLLETAVLTPERLATLVSCAIPPGGEPRYEIRLSGRLRAESCVSWPAPEGAGRWTHEAVFNLHQALIPGERLRAGDGGSFFALRPAPPAGDPDGLAGMVEIPCLAQHRIDREESGSRNALLEWTAAQRLRLGAAESFLEEIALRGARRVEELAARRRIKHREWLEVRPAPEVEQGFVGPLGDALAAALRGAPTMVLEATDAFWLRLPRVRAGHPGSVPWKDGPPQGGAGLRGSVPLWKDGPVVVTCRPTRDDDFVPASEADAHDWVRTPVPFLTDSRGVLRRVAAASPAGELARLLANQPRRRPAPRPTRPPSPAPLPRESLVHRRDLDRHSLQSPPIPPGPGAPVDQVLLQPDAYERLLPFVRAVAGFEPGWLVFTQWEPGTSEPDFAVPFAATAESLGPLIAAAAASRAPALAIAATEVVPAARGDGAPWQRALGPGGRPMPYLVPSPAVDIEVAEEQARAEVERDIRILLELWQPAAGVRRPGEDLAPRLLARAVFRFGLRPQDTWKTVLAHGAEEGEEANRLRAAPWRWLQKQRTLAPPGVSSLLRARTLIAAAELSATAYFLLAPAREAIAVASARRERLAPRVPARPDPRLESLAEAPAPDPLALGPDYRAGRVFYEERTQFTPAVPELDHTGSGSAIESFTFAAFAESDVVDSAQEVTLSWKLKKDHPVILASKDGALRHPVKSAQSGSLVVKPTRTTIYVLQALDEAGQVVDFRELAVRVRTPAAGSAVGLSYKIAGTGPGPHHPSRLPRSDRRARGHRWIESVRDLLFVDRTRRDEASRHEPGWLLPASRRLAGRDALGEDLHPFLPTQVTHLFTAGRPGDFVRLRTSLLAEDRDGWLRRGASLAHELRHPRPVPLPPELAPFHPKAPGRTARVELLDSRPPFGFAALEWQDPIYNRRLLAVAQESGGDGLTLTLDRTVYAGQDVLYPELRFEPPTGTEEWSIVLTVRIQRQEGLRLLTLEEISYEITESTVRVVKPPSADRQADPTVTVREPAPAEGFPRPLRWVFELGLGQDLDRERPFDQIFKSTPLNQDEILAEATLAWTVAGAEKSRAVTLRGRVRTDLQVWPQPQAAYGILRRRSLDGGAPEIVAFGWLPKPAVIRRGDRFRPESWEGTFRYRDAWIERAPLFGIAEDHARDLRRGKVEPGLRSLFTTYGHELPSDAAIAAGEKENGWRLIAGAALYTLRLAGDQIQVYATETVEHEVATYTAYGEQLAPPQEGAGR